MFEVAALGTMCALLGTIATILVMRPFAPRLGLIDQPDERKRHEAPTPAIGGLAMFVVMATLNLAFHPPSLKVIGFDMAALILVVAGAIDDRNRLRWYVRMAAQIVGALVLIHVAGIGVDDLGSVIGYPVRLLQPWSDLLSIVAIVGVINSVNMMDGVDGLAGSVSMVAIALLIGISVYAGNLALASDLLAAAAALIGFLMFNLRFPWNRRASIFLGNAGAELLGLIIAAAAFQLTQNIHHPISPKLAPFLLAPALIDCLTLIIRRLRRGVSPFQADRDHLHHLLLDSGLTPTGVVSVIAALTLVIALAALLAAKAHVSGIVFTCAFIVLWAAYVLATRSRERFVGFCAKGIARRTWRGDPALRPLAPLGITDDANLD